ncbi:LysR family transcriptional regulator [Shewanella donghaensis]|uniref:LysR family transcriptional regulator n=1 Tax=Shewanella donghaensis TaxID=238836 RepID=UPI0011843A33|nr:LysR family transcriptional regulator [Shewanella donghaensis]
MLILIGDNQPLGVMYQKYSEQVNLNYLRIFNELYITRSTTLAAEKLGISQSAVSQILSKLRQVTGDPLFIKGQGKLVPTVRANSIGQGLATQLGILEQRLFAEDFFIQEEFDGEICFALSSPLFDVLALPLVKLINKLFPKAKVDFVHWNDRTIEQIINGDVHIGLNFFPIPAPKEIRQIPLVETLPVFVTSEPSSWIEDGMEQSQFSEHTFAGMMVSGINRIQAILENNDRMKGFKFRYRSESQVILAAHLQSEKSVVLIDKLSAKYYENHHIYQAPEKLLPLLPSRLSYSLYYLQANHHHPIYTDSESIIKKLIVNLLEQVDIIPNKNLG